MAYFFAKQQNLLHAANWIKQFSY